MYPPHGHIITYTERVFNPLVCKVDDIDIKDIAHALANTCRFGGHCKPFYSVAEHSVRMLSLVGRELHSWVLLHDATEAYLCDLPRPVKYQLSGYAEAEVHLRKVIAAKFDLMWYEPNGYPYAVEKADEDILRAEYWQLCKVYNLPHSDWFFDLEEDKVMVVDFRNSPTWAPEQAEKMFLDWATIIL